MYTKKAAIKL